jgi:glycine cleavage system H lipoate-binding protein
MDKSISPASRSTLLKTQYNFTISVGDMTEVQRTHLENAMDIALPDVDVDFDRQDQLLRCEFETDIPSSKAAQEMHGRIMGKIVDILRSMERVV